MPIVKGEKLILNGIFQEKKIYVLYVYKNYQQWCKDVEADSYGYNYWEPKYNLGRAPIGSLLNETYESLIDKFTESPFISKVELING